MIRCRPSAVFVSGSGTSTGGLGRRAVGHQAALPNNPAGFTSSTMAMMMKITVADASG